jgi:hypothetical protein
MTGVATMSNAVSFVKNDIMGFFRRTNSRSGAILTRVFFHKQYSRYNPKQQEAFDQAVRELVTDRLLEKRDDSLYLTHKGEDEIYQ